MNGSPLPSIDSATDEVPEEVRRAEAAIAALAGPFVASAHDNLARAKKILEEARANAPDNGIEVKEIYRICHDLKGQAGSFGFDLATMIAASVCDLIRDANRVSKRRLRVVEAHLSALGLLFDRGIKGQGGAPGQRLMGALQRLASSSA